MSLFNAFGQNGFAALTQTLENIGNIVAPIAPNDTEEDGEANERDDESEEGESFDSKIQNFFTNMRETYQHQHSDQTTADNDIEPGSPASFVSIELSGESPRSASKLNNAVSNSSDSASYGYVSGVELEKKVQLKYREQLEDEISSLERKFTELQVNSTKKIQLLERECAEWKVLAEDLKGQSGSGGDDDKEEELNTLYEKLGLLTQELEDKESELSAAQETILSLNADSISHNLRELNNDSNLQAQLEEVTNELIEQQNRNALSQEHLQELEEALERSEQQGLKYLEENKGKEEDLLNLTNQLRTSNKAIAALEQRLAEAQSVEPAADEAHSQQSFAELQTSLAAYEKSHMEDQERLLNFETENTGLRDLIAARESQIETLTDVSSSLQEQLTKSSTAASSIAHSIEETATNMLHSKEQLNAAHEEVARLRELLTARDADAQEMHRAALADAETRLEEVRLQLIESQEAWSVRVGELEAERELLAAQLQDSNTAVEESALKSSSLSDELLKMSRHASQLQATVDDVDLQLSAMTEDRNAAISAEERLQTEVNQLQLALEASRDAAGTQTEANETLAQLRDTQRDVADLQERLLASDQNLSESQAAHSAAAAEHSAVVVAHEEARAAFSARTGELEAQVLRLSGELHEVAASSSDRVAGEVALRDQLAEQEGRLVESAQELASLHAAIEDLSAQLAEVAEDRNRLVESNQILTNQLAERTTAVSGPSAESPRVLVSAASSQDLKVPSMDGSQTAEEALAASQAEFAKAIKKIKAVNKQLKDRDAEIAKLKETSAAAELERHTSQKLAPDLQGEFVSNLQATLAEVELAKKELQEQLAAAQSEIQELLSKINAQDDLSSDAQTADAQIAALRSELASTTTRVADLDAALTSSEETLQAAEEAAWQAKAEAGELLFALEQEQAKVQDLTKTRDAFAPLQSEVEALRGDLRDKDCEVKQLRDESQHRAAAATAIEDDLREKVLEISSLRDSIAARSSDLEKVQQEVHESLTKRQQDIDLLKSQLGDALQACATQTSLIEANESHISELTEQAEAAHQRVVQVQNEMQVLHSEHSDALSRLGVATTRVADLDAALTSSEETLQAAEEAAWQAKAEAGELLFALEQEQAKVQDLTKTRDALQDQLGMAQAQLQNAVEQTPVGNHIANVEEVQAQLAAIYQSLQDSSDLLRFTDINASGSDSLLDKDSATFDHLVTHCAADLVSPLSMLVLAAKTQSNLANQITTYLRDQIDQVETMRAVEATTAAALRDASKVLDVLIKLTNPGSTNEETDLQPTDLVATALKMSAGLDVLTKLLEEKLFRESAGAQESDALKNELEQVQAEIAQLREGAVRDKLASTSAIQQAEARIAALQSEISDNAAQFEDAFRKISLEKQQAVSDLHTLQSGSAQFADQIQSLKAHILKIDTENKQLHQVIAQLRQVRKTSKGESDNAITERDELRAHCNSLQAEMSSLQQQLRNFTVTEEAAAVLRSELSQVVSSLATSERHLESTRRALAQIEKDSYDRSAELEVTRSDILLVRQELDRRLVEVSNLKEAIHQVESERDFYVSRAQRELAEKLEATRLQSETDRSALEAKLSQQLEDERARRLKLEESSQDHELFHRKAELDFNKEKKKMQRTLENALAQLNNSQQQVIDRMLVANLIVQYFKRRRSVDVLKIIAKVLSFDDEQLIAVGLKVPPIDLIGTLLTTVMGRPAPAPEVKGDNLAEQWINFLIDESDQDAGNSAGLVTRSRSHSDSAPPMSPTNRKVGADVDISIK